MNRRNFLKLVGLAALGIKPPLPGSEEFKIRLTPLQMEILKQLRGGKRIIYGGGRACGKTFIYEYWRKHYPEEARGAIVIWREGCLPKIENPYLTKKIKAQAEFMGKTFYCFDEVP